MQNVGLAVLQGELHIIARGNEIFVAGAGGFLFRFGRVVKLELFVLCEGLALFHHALRELFLAAGLNGHGGDLLLCTVFKRDAEGIFAVGLFADDFQLRDRCGGGLCRSRGGCGGRRCGFCGRRILRSGAAGAKYERRADERQRARFHFIVHGVNFLSDLGFAVNLHGHSRYT